MAESDLMRNIRGKCQTDQISILNVVIWDVICNNNNNTCSVLCRGDAAVMAHIWENNIMEEVIQAG